MSERQEDTFDNEAFSHAIDGIRARLRQTSAMSSSSLDTLAERQRDASAKSAISIVYADDDERYRHLLGALLKSYPRFAVVGEAANGQQAIALAIALRPDVVLLDVGMPDVDGVDAAAAIRRAMPATRVVLHTGEVGGDRAEKARQLGLELADKIAINETLDRIAGELDGVL